MQNSPCRRFILGPLSGFLSGDGLLSSLLFCSGSPSSAWSTLHSFSGLLSGFWSVLGLASFLWFILGVSSGFRFCSGLLRCIQFILGLAGSLRFSPGPLRCIQFILGVLSSLHSILGVSSGFQSVLRVLIGLRLCLILSGYRRNITTVSGGCSHLFQHLLLQVHGISPGRFCRNIISGHRHQASNLAIPLSQLSLAP